jgi:DUF1680 family protein
MTASGYPLSAPAIDAVEVTGGFWGDWLHTYRTVTLPHILRRLDSEGRIRNFQHAAGDLPGGFEGTYRFNDSDVYKTLEGMAYSLAVHPDPALLRQGHAIIDAIRRAQAEDGYLFTHVQLAAPESRWTDMNSHEMYCGGHLIEAAVAWHQATGESVLLDVARRLADHYLATFGPGRRHWVDGHEEVGLALTRLAQETGDRRYLEFAYWHLEERGHGHGRGSTWDLPGFGAVYSQDHVPVRDIREAEGHAVRAMYLYSAMTDQVAVGSREEYRTALMAAWDSVVGRKMYITGGIGAVGDYEGFGPDYFLPHREAYCETCAAVAMVYWNHRLNQLTGEARYADLVELELFNGVLAGLSLSGDRFFYDNPLASDGSHHRQPWHDCACCPSNLARFMPRVGHYAYLAGPEGLYVNQFMSVTARLEWQGVALRIAQETRYPWDGATTVSLPDGLPEGASLLVRMPAWARSVSLQVNGSPRHGIRAEAGYLKLPGPLPAGTAVEVSWPLPVERVYEPPAVEASRGKTALKRGPLVYCFEAADNPTGVGAIRLEPESVVVAETGPTALGGLIRLRALSTGSPDAIAIPYYAWDNREPGPMTVWIPVDASPSR